MSRIVAGRAGGARLHSVRGQNTRPTTDRVKEALFSRLESYGVLTDAAVLDLFAGSGALGLEAGSRGAASVRLVDRDRSALSACRANAAVLARAGAPTGVEITEASAPAWLRRTPAEPAWDLVFVDPPYALAEDELAGILAELSPRVREGGVVVVERSVRSPEPVWPEGLERFSQKSYGETALWYAEPAGPSPESPGTDQDH